MVDASAAAVVSEAAGALVSEMFVGVSVFSEVAGVAFSSGADGVWEEGAAELATGSPVCCSEGVVVASCLAWSSAAFLASSAAFLSAALRSSAAFLSSCLIIHCLAN